MTEFYTCKTVTIGSISCCFRSCGCSFLSCNQRSLDTTGTSWPETDTWPSRPATWSATASFNGDCWRWQHSCEKYKQLKIWNTEEHQHWIKIHIHKGTNSNSVHTVHIRVLDVTWRLVTLDIINNDQAVDTFIISRNTRGQLSERALQEHHTQPYIIKWKEDWKFKKLHQRLTEILPQHINTVCKKDGIAPYKKNLVLQRLLVTNWSNARICLDTDLHPTDASISSTLGVFEYTKRTL